MRILMPLMAGLAFALPAAAQQFTTAAEVRPILEATKRSWVAVREYDGKDLLYFTQLLSWRCGLEGIGYAVNGGPQQPWPMEPCYEDAAQPNAIKSESILPYTAFPLSSVETISVQIVYDDGVTDTADYNRADVMTP